jgi:hypothetical protein
MKRIGMALRTAPMEHRILALLVLSALWLVLEYQLQYHVVAKGVEVFGLAPFADRAIALVFGE